MATVTASYNWVSGETVTPAKLNTTAAPTVVVADNEVTTAKILDANVTNAKLADASITAQKFGTTEQKRIAKAWVHFNGSGTFSPNPSTSQIDDSFNVQSVTKNGAGSYRINFTNNLSDSNYAIIVTSSSASSGGLLACQSGTRSASSVDILTFKLDGSATDSADISCVVF
jgi:hypothetical protein